MSFLSEKLTESQYAKSVMIMVDPLLLHPDPENDLLYGEFDPEKDEDKRLIEEIQELGLLQPLLVKRHPVFPDEYIIVSGHRRYHAAKAVGLRRVEVLVMNTNTPEEQAMAKLAITVSNHSRDRSNPALLAREIEHLEASLKELRKLNPEKFKGKELRTIIAEELGVSPKTVARTKKILNNADDQTRIAFTSGKITQLEALKRVDDKLKPNHVESNSVEPLPGQLSIDSTVQKITPTIGEAPKKMSEKATSAINMLVRITEKLELDPEIATDQNILKLIADLEKAIYCKSNNKK